jgi:predicted amidophosphoribosyltransferase
MNALVILVFLLAGIGVYWYAKRSVTKALEIKCPNCGASVKRSDPLCKQCGRDMESFTKKNRS